MPSIAVPTAVSRRTGNALVPPLTARRRETMLQTSELSTDHIIRALRVYVNDLTATHSPFTKGPEYMRELASWIACAATRLEALSGDATTHGQFSSAK